MSNRVVDPQGNYFLKKFLEEREEAVMKDTYVSV